MMDSLDRSLKMPLPRVSLRDIAGKLGVSHVTVSLALRDHPKISVECRKRVQRLAHKLGYRPDPMLSALVAYRNDKRTNSITATLGWLNRWPVPGDLRKLQEFNAYWEGAQSAANQAGYRLEEFAVSSDMSAARLRSILVTRAVHGLLIPPHPSGVNWSDFDFPWRQFALVRFGFSVSDIKIHMVGNDQMRSGELAVRRIADAGYKRIGYLTTEAEDRNTDGNFRVGYQRGIEALGGVPRLDPLILPLKLSASGVRSSASLKKWLARQKPDAIFTTEPELYPTLQSLGVRVPDQLGLAATSTRDGGLIDAGLDQNPVEIGRVATHTLIDLVNRYDRGFPSFCRRILVEGRWTDGVSLPPRR